MAEHCGLSSDESADAEERQSFTTPKCKGKLKSKTPNNCDFQWLKELNLQSWTGVLDSSVSDFMVQQDCKLYGCADF